MASLVAPARKKLLAQLRCSIFETAYNEGGKRTGGKYLKRRFVGPSMVEYYPPKTLTIRKINKMFPDMNVRDELEEQRVVDINERKARGKGAPKKVRSKGMFCVHPDANT
jgi:small subunit ribosomal protein S33